MLRNIAIFGLGRIGYTHFSTLCDLGPSVRVTWVVEDDLEGARSKISKHCPPNSVSLVPYSEAGQVYWDQSIWAVFVCTPHATHQEITINAIQSGKHVFCEKPMTLSVQSTRLCYQAAKDHKKTLFCAFQKRHDNQFREIYDRIRARDVGVLHKVKVTSHEPSGVATYHYLKQSGGIFIDTLVHDFDLLLWLVDERPTEVFVMGHAFRDVQRKLSDIDSAVISMKFPSGVIGVIDVDRSAEYGFDQRLEVSGDKATIISENPRRDGSGSVLLKAEGSYGAGIEQSFLTRWKQAYRSEVCHFLKALEGEATLESDSDDIVFRNVMVDACQLSHREGRPVRLAELTS